MVPLLAILPCRIPCMKGNYRIRAYTQYMLNDGRNYVFDKAINISNAIVNKVFIKTTFNYTHQQANSPVGTTINYSDINGAPYEQSGTAFLWSYCYKNVFAQAKSDVGG
jgi:hypothetical protein